MAVTIAEPFEPGSTTVQLITHCLLSLSLSLWGPTHSNCLQAAGPVNGGMVSWLLGIVGQLYGCLEKGVQLQLGRPLASDRLDAIVGGLTKYLTCIADRLIYLRQSIRIGHSFECTSLHHSVYFSQRLTYIFTGNETVVETEWPVRSPCICAMDPCCCLFYL